MLKQLMIAAVVALAMWTSFARGDDAAAPPALQADVPADFVDRTIPGMQLKVPKEWKDAPMASSQKLRLVNVQQASIAIEVNDLAPDETIQSILDDTTKGARQKLKQVNVTRSELITINGDPASRLRFECVGSNSVPLSVCLIDRTHGQNTYIYTLTTRPGDIEPLIPIFEAVIVSSKPADPNPAGLRYTVTAPTGWTKLMPDTPHTALFYLLHSDDWGKADGMMKLDIAALRADSAKAVAQALVGPKGKVLPAEVKVDGVAGARAELPGKDLMHPQLVVVALHDHHAYMFMAAGAHGTDVTKDFDAYVASFRWPPPSAGSDTAAQPEPAPPAEIDPAQKKADEAARQARLASHMLNNADNPADQPWHAEMAKMKADKHGLPNGAVKTDIAGGFGGEPYLKLDKANRPVVGFRIELGDSSGKVCVHSVDPLFDRTPPKPAEQNATVKIVLAKPGYVVSGLEMTNDHYARSMTVIFGKLASGRIDLKDTYTSEEFADPQEGVLNELGNTGQLVIGTYGKQGMHMDGIGLVMKFPAPAAPAK